MKRFTLSCSALAVAALALSNAPRVKAQSTFFVGSQHTNSQFSVAPSRSQRRGFFFQSGYQGGYQGGLTTQTCTYPNQPVGGGGGQIWTGNDPSWPPAVQTQTSMPQQLLGTWEENYQGGRLTHQLSGNGLHTITYANGRTKRHMARWNGNGLKLLDATYQVNSSGPQQIQLTTFQQTRTWTRPGSSQFGGFTGGGGTLDGGTQGGGTSGGGIQNAGLSARMQGTWYDVSPDANRDIWQYDLRGNNYDMYARNRQTGAVRVTDGELEQLQDAPLTYQNGILTLSPGPDAEGPYRVTPSSDGSQLRLESLDGSSVRLLTRQPQI